jgi:hypothetical protein
MSGRPLYPAIWPDSGISAQQGIEQEADPEGVCGNVWHG